jgi:uncharacterized protein YjbJ (UPF0337 family)
MRISFKNNRRRENLGRQGRSDALRGRVTRMLGKIQHKAGQLTGNRKMRARGTALQMKGSWQSRIGRAKQKIQNALSHVRG